MKKIILSIVCLSLLFLSFYILQDKPVAVFGEGPGKDEKIATPVEISELLSLCVEKQAALANGRFESNLDSSFTSATITIQEDYSFTISSGSLTNALTIKISSDLQLYITENSVYAKESSSVITDGFSLDFEGQVFSNSDKTLICFNNISTTEQGLYFIFSQITGKWFDTTSQETYFNYLDSSWLQLFRKLSPLVAQLNNTSESAYFDFNNSKIVVPEEKKDVFIKDVLSSILTDSSVASAIELNAFSIKATNTSSPTINMNVVATNKFDNGALLKEELREHIVISNINNTIGDMDWENIEIYELTTVIKNALDKIQYSANTERS